MCFCIQLAFSSTGGFCDLLPWSPWASACPASAARAIVERRMLFLSRLRWGAQWLDSWFVVDAGLDFVVDSESQSLHSDPMPVCAVVCPVPRPRRRNSRPRKLRPVGPRSRASPRGSRGRQGTGVLHPTNKLRHRAASAIGSGHLITAIS
jgi:hypothetical protein